MGLASWLIGIGIVRENISTAFGTRAGKVPLQWPVGERRGFIHRLPRDPHLRASLFSTQQTIVVNEGEIAVVLQDGSGMGDLEPGRYTFHKLKVVGALDVVWITTGQQPIKWGIGNVASADGIQISANGVVYVRVIDGAAFHADIVQGATTLSELDVQRFLMPRIQGLLRAVIAKTPALELQTQREAFLDKSKETLGAAFKKMGLGIVDFEVIEFNLPPEFKAAIAQSTLVHHTAKASILEAQARAQITQLESTAAAQAQLTAGMAQVQVMAQLQNQGIDPLRLKALEALQSLAEHPTTGSINIGADPRNQLFGQVAVAALSGGFPMGPPVAAPPPALPAPPAQGVLPGSSPAASGSGGEVPAAAGAASVADIERQIDSLTARLAEGKISEETYNKLVSRLEGKLAALKK